MTQGGLHLQQVCADVDDVGDRAALSIADFMRGIAGQLGDVDSKAGVVEGVDC
jgi:hypothetical protein